MKKKNENIKAQAPYSSKQSEVKLGPTPTGISTSKENFRKDDYSHLYS